VLHEDGKDDKESREHLQPPQPSSTLRARVESGELTFTNGSDADFVFGPGGLYDRTLASAYGSNVILMKGDAGWGDAEATAFASSLPLCTSLWTWWGPPCEAAFWAPFSSFRPSRCNFPPPSTLRTRTPQLAFLAIRTVRTAA